MAERIFTPEEHRREAERLKEMIERMEKGLATVKARYKYHAKEAGLINNEHSEKGNRMPHSSEVKEKSEKWEEFLGEPAFIGKEEIRKQLKELYSYNRSLARDVKYLLELIDDFSTYLWAYLKKEASLDEVYASLNEIDTHIKGFEDTVFGIRETISKLKELLEEVELT